MQRRTFSRIILIPALCSLPAIAQEGNGWQFDSLGLNTTSPESDAQQVYDVLLKMLDRWNAHDIEGYLEVYWKSSELLVVIDSEQFNGWQQLHDSYIDGYPDRNAMVGNTTINLQKFDDGWKVVASHSSTAEI
jgi:hypothetical protein